MSPRKGTVSPASRRARLADVLRRAQRDRPAGLTFAELLAAYRIAYPASRATHDTLSASLGALLYDGEVRQSAVSSGVVRYRMSRTRRVGGDSEDALAGRVVEIVAELYVEHGRPVATREISGRLRALGLWPHRYAGLHHLLNRLARSAGDEATNIGARKRSTTDPALRRVHNTTATGRRSAFWIPTRSRRCRAAPQPTRPTTAADALRRAVDAAALGRPIAARELRWWLESLPLTDPMRDALGSGRLGRVLKNVADVDRPHAGRAGRLHVVTSDLTCHGGAPPRYLLRRPSDAEIAACRLEDALYALRPAEEMRAIDELSGSRLHSRDPTSVPLMEARGRALRRKLEPWVSRNAVRRLRASLNTVEGWFDRTSASSEGAWFTRQRFLTDARVQLAASTRFLRERDGAMGSRRSRRMPWGEPAVLIGEGALVEPKALRTVAKLAVRAGDLDAGRPDLVYAAARRFPPPGPRPDNRLPVGGELAAIDRADAIVALVARSRCPHARTLVGAAHGYLGEVIRDAGWIAELMAARPHLSGTSRVALIVAMGVLGEAVPFKAAVTSDPDTEAARAYLLGAALACLAVDQALDYATRFAAVARGPARQVAASAVDRLRAGHLLGLVEQSGFESDGSG